MQNMDFLDIIGKIDIKYVEDAMSSDESKTHKKTSINLIIPILAAGLSLTIGIAGICYRDSSNSQKALEAPKNTEDLNTINNETGVPYQSDETSVIIMPMVASAKQRFTNTLNSIYSDPSYILCDTIQCSYINPDYLGESEDQYNWRLELYVKDNWFIGNYSKRVLDESNGIDESIGAEIKGTIINPFTRLNDYSFHASVQLDVPESHNVLDDVVETYDRNTNSNETYTSESYQQTYSMEAFSNPDELILFLPNTPKAALPECTNKEWIESIIASDTSYTQRFLIYNTEENVMFIANANPAIPEIKEPDKDLMQGLLGSYKEESEESSQADNGAYHHTVECCIYYDSSSGEYKMDATIDSCLVFKEMDILQRISDVDENGDIQLVLFGKEESSGTMVFFLAKLIEGDESEIKPIRLIVAESNEVLLPVSTYLPLMKTDLDIHVSESYSETTEMA